MLELPLLDTFTKIFEHGGIAAAARHTGLTASGTSKALTRLETYLGVRLLNRTTRRLSLTHEGRDLLPRCRRILDEARFAEREVVAGRTSTRGHLRVDLPLVLARRFICPRLPEFFQSHPDVSITLTFEDKYSELIRDSVDVAIRIGILPDSTLVARRLFQMERQVCAAPSYFQRCGKPRNPADLANHQCLTHTLGPHERPVDWVFKERQGIRHLPVKGSLSASRGQVLVDAAVQGLGVVQLYDYFVEEALTAGTLARCLESYACPGPPVSILFAPAQARVSRIRAFVDFVTKVCTRARERDAYPK